MKKVASTDENIGRCWGLTLKTIQSTVKIENLPFLVNFGISKDHFWRATLFEDFFSTNEIAISLTEGRTQIWLTVFSKESVA